MLLSRTENGIVLYLYFSTSDFSDSPYVKDRSLPAEALELHRSHGRTVEAEPRGVAEHEPGCKEQNLVDEVDGKPFHQPDGKPEYRSSQHLTRQHVDLFISYRNMRT